MPPPAPADDFDASFRRDLIEAINGERADEGLSALTIAPAVQTLADREAHRVAETRSLQRTPGDIMELGRELRGEGYRFHHWKERFVVGERRPDRLLKAWRREAPEDYRALVLGDYEHVGVGLDRMPRGNPIVCLVVGIPESTIFYRRAAALDDLDAVRERIREQTNALRLEANRAPVVANPVLDAVAQAYAEELRVTGRYAHTGDDGSHPAERVRAAGYDYRWVAENLAKGPFQPEEVVERWYGSSGHRANMLHPRAREIGIGVAYGETGGRLDVLWVMVLGER